MPDPIFILNGPNLNRLGTREPQIYGSATLADVEAACAARAKALGYAIDFRQTNIEGELVTWVQEAADKAAALVINPAAYGHTSVALHDALKLVSKPIIEVHLSNLAKREPFRHRSYVSPLADGVIAGLGLKGYELAVEAACSLARERSS
jgi:3-dehydroquinate dehydratase-2